MTASSMNVTNSTATVPTQSTWTIVLNGQTGTIYVSTIQWSNGTVSTSGGGITALTGDVAASGSGSVAATVQALDGIDLYFQTAVAGSVVNTYSLANGSYSNPATGAADGSGNIWFPSSAGPGVIKFVIANQAMTLYSTAGIGWSGIAFDGTNMWLSGNGSGNQYVGKITPSGTFTYSSLGGGTAPAGIAFDGTNMWVVGDSIVSMVTPSGTVTNYTLTERYASCITFDGTDMWVGTNPGSAGFYERVSTATGETTGDWLTSGVDGVGLSITACGFDGKNVWMGGYTPSPYTDGAVIAFSPSDPDSQTGTADITCRGNNFQYNVKALVFDGSHAMWSVAAGGGDAGGGDDCINSISLPPGYINTQEYDVDSGTSEFVGVLYDGNGNLWTANNIGKSTTEFAINSSSVTPIGGQTLTTTAANSATWLTPAVSTAGVAGAGLAVSTTTSVAGGTMFVVGNSSFTVTTSGLSVLGSAAGTCTQMYRCTGGSDAGWLLYGTSGAAAALCTGAGGTLTATPLCLP
jgi:hypothetical protein